MSATVKLSAILAGNDEFNGLDSEAERLLDEPTKLRVGLVVYDVRNVIEDIDADTRVPVVRIRKFEPLGTVGEVPDAITMQIAAAHERRTGRIALPLNVLDAREAHVDIVSDDDDERPLADVLNPFGGKR